MSTRPRFVPVVLGLLLFARAEATPLPGDTAAMVNGVAIPRKALLDVVQAVIAQLDDIPDTATTEKYRRQALDSLIDFELLYQDAQKRKLEVPPAEVAAEIKKTEKGFPSPEAYRQALKSKGLTQKDIEQETRRALLVNRLLTDVVWPGISVSDEQVTRFYDEHRSDFQHPEQIRASYILVRWKSPGDKAAARDKAAELAKRARDGEDFAGLARAASDDPATAPNGGDLGYISRGTMGESFDRVAFTLAPGQVSDVVETSFGYAVITVASKRPAGVSPAAEVRDRIAAVIREEGREKAQQKFVAELRSQATIEVAPDVH